MNGRKIQPVTTRSDLKKFIDFPYQLHKNDSHWIAPLRLDQINIFNPEKNSMLKHCEYQLFLLTDGNQIIGRIAVYVNQHFNEYWQASVGFWGHYECIDDSSAADELFRSAENWLQKKKMRSMRGPWNFISQDFGFIIEGYDLDPVILSSYNPPYYNSQAEKYGMKKSKDLYVYNCDVSKGYVIPERFLKMTDTIARRYRVNVRSIDMKHLLQDVKSIVQLSNESLAGNWGYYPIELSEAENIAADLKMIIHPQAILIAEVDQKPIGYVIALPDVNQILKKMRGRLFPTGLFKLLFGIKKLNRYRVWAMGIANSYQRKGISVLLFRRLNDLLAPRKVYVEANYVLEDNHLMNNALIQLKFDLVKKYRVYDKEIAR